MDKRYALPILAVLALVLGGLPAAREYVEGLTLPEPHTGHLTAPVVMYSTQWCPYCRKAEAYFKRHKIAFIEYDIEASVENRERFTRLGGSAVPLILVGDRRMQGFSARSFKALLDESRTGADPNAGSRR